MNDVPGRERDLSANFGPTRAIKSLFCATGASHGASARIALNLRVKSRIYGRPRQQRSSPWPAPHAPEELGGAPRYRSPSRGAATLIPRRVREERPTAARYSAAAPPPRFSGRLAAMHGAGSSSKRYRTVANAPLNGDRVGPLRRCARQRAAGFTADVAASFTRHWRRPRIFAAAVDDAADVRLHCLTAPAALTSRAHSPSFARAKRSRRWHIASRDDVCSSSCYAIFAPAGMVYIALGAPRCFEILILTIGIPG